MCHVRKSIAVIGLALLGAAAWAGCTKESPSGGGNAAAAGAPARAAAPVLAAPVLAAPVLAAPVVRQSAPVQIHTFGWGRANLTVALKSQITGVLMTVGFREGEHVKQGQVLFTLDPRPFEAALQQAEGNLLRDKAQHENAVREARRQEELLKKGVVAQGDFDAAQATADALAAAVKADAAAVDRAQVDLSYCTISAPIDGRMGAWLVDRGNLVKADDVTMAVINQVQPIQVAFAVPQRDLPEIQREMAKRKLEVRAFIPGDEGPPEVGDLAFVDNTVDPTTGMIGLKALFKNAQERLWPGLFVTVVLTVRDDPDAITIPGCAVQVGQKGQYVFVVKPDLTVEARPITVSRPLDGDVVVSEGLQVGERVVTDGQLRLVPGAKVEIKTSLAGAEVPQP
jgi:multidrug efflux system membrane fusion protein